MERNFPQIYWNFAHKFIRKKIKNKEKKGEGKEKKRKEKEKAEEKEKEKTKRKRKKKKKERERKNEKRKKKKKEKKRKRKTPVCIFYIWLHVILCNDFISCNVLLFALLCWIYVIVIILYLVYDFILETILLVKMYGIIALIFLCILGLYYHSTIFSSFFYVGTYFELIC